MSHTSTIIASQLGTTDICTPHDAKRNGFRYDGLKALKVVVDFSKLKNAKLSDNAPHAAPP